MRPVGLQASGVLVFLLGLFPHLHPALSPVTSTTISTQWAARFWVSSPFTSQVHLSAEVECDPAGSWWCACFASLKCSHLSVNTCYNLGELSMASAVMERHSEKMTLISYSLGSSPARSCRCESPIRSERAKGYGVLSFSEIPEVPTELRW